MPFIPGQRDQLFEALKGTITGEGDNGKYARNVLGYSPIDESVMVSEIPAGDREYVLQSLLAKKGKQGPLGFHYGQRAVYGDREYRIDGFNEQDNDNSSPKLTLTLIDSEGSVRLSGVNANQVTVPTPTTANEGFELDEMVNQMVASEAAKWIKEYTPIIQRDIKEMGSKLAEAGNISDPELLSALEVSIKAMMGASLILGQAKGIISMLKYASPKAKDRAMALAAHLKAGYPKIMTHFR
jgi:hypothetical protein